MALRWFLQMSAAEATVLHGDHADIFGMGGTNGMARVAIDALPVVRFTERSSVDASGDLIACSVCLQVLLAATTACYVLEYCHGWCVADISTRIRKLKPVCVRLF